MRQHKYRAWDKDKKIMIYDHDQSWAHHYFLEPGNSLHLVVWNIGHIFETLMQCTELFDIDHTEIFEDDIVKWGVHIGKVYKLYGTWCFGDGLGLYPPCLKAKVIGNIHQNPELLEIE